MVYNMTIYCDGGCRRNGLPGAIGAAAAVFKLVSGAIEPWTVVLPQEPPPTNQRAELIAIIIALDKALEKVNRLRMNPFVNVRIYTDSQYTVDCMTDWVYGWLERGWITHRGLPVKNQDLVQEAFDLDQTLKQNGRVKYYYIPREQNQDADRACNAAMDAIY